MALAIRPLANLLRTKSRSAVLAAPKFRYTHTESANSGPLKGIKIVDLSRVLAVSRHVIKANEFHQLNTISQGPFCTQILADYGADVIKIEHPSIGVCPPRVTVTETINLLSLRMTPDLGAQTAKRRSGNRGAKAYQLTFPT